MQFNPSIGFVMKQCVQLNGDDVVQHLVDVDVDVDVDMCSNILANIMTYIP